MPLQVHFIIIGCCRNKNSNIALRLYYFSFENSTGLKFCMECLVYNFSQREGLWPLLASTSPQITHHNFG
jgi:hypothetical protein